MQDPPLPGKWAKAEVLFWADGEYTNCLTDMDRTDMGTGWEEEDAAEGKVEEQGCWGDMGSRREGGSLGHVSGVLPTAPAAWAAASVHVLIDFLEQGVQQGFALRLL